MQLDLAFTPAELDHFDLHRKVAVVIDVFRFTTAAQAALEQGAAGIFVVRDVEEALRLRQENPSLSLAGERQALKIPGFDFGNSPLEFSPEKVKDKQIVWCTTNGTNAVTRARSAELVILASLRSAKAVAELVKAQQRDCVFVPAGLRGRYSLEDTWCAGYIADQIGVPHVSDSVRAAQLISRHYLIEELRASEHGEVLSGMGLHDDLEYCLELNSTSAIIVQDPKSGWCRLAKDGIN